MTPAGTPPQPRTTSGTPPQSHPGPPAGPEESAAPTHSGRPALTAGAGTAGPVGDSPFARLVANGSYRVPSPAAAAAPDHRHGDWNEPDPGAGLALGAGRTPYDRALARWKEGTSRDRARSKFRSMARILTADDTGDQAADITVDWLRAHPWHLLSVDQVHDFRADVYKRYTNQGTRNDVVCMLRALVQQCFKLQLISALRRELLLEQLYTISPGPSTRRHRISEEEFDRLMDACLSTGDEFARARNSAMVALFRTTGLRVCEIVRIDLDDWDRREDTITLLDTKNGDNHLIFLHTATKILLLEWLEVRGTEPGKLFTGAGTPITQALHPHTMRLMLASRCKKAGITQFRTHDFRRTFATEMLRRYDAALVSKLMNHRKLSSTLIYDMASHDEMRNAVGSINLTIDGVGGAA